MNKIRKESLLWGKDNASISINSDSVVLIKNLSKSPCLCVCCWKKHKVHFLGGFPSAAFRSLHLTLVLFLEETNLKSLWFSSRRSSKHFHLLWVVWCLNKLMQLLLLTATGFISAGLAGFVLAMVERCYQHLIVYCLHNGTGQPTPAFKKMLWIGWMILLRYLSDWEGATVTDEDLLKRIPVTAGGRAAGRWPSLRNMAALQWAGDPRVGEGHQWGRALAKALLSCIVLWGFRFFVPQRI